jgi:hypothetical protein
MISHADDYVNGKEVRIPIGQVERISYENSTVFVNLTKDAVDKSPEDGVIANGLAVSTKPMLAL